MTSLDSLGANDEPFDPPMDDDAWEEWVDAITSAKTIEAGHSVEGAQIATYFLPAGASGPSVGFHRFC